MSRYIPALCGLVVCLSSGAQLSLSSAVNLALQSSPRIKMAQADVDRARAGLQETRDAFIPSVGVSGGIGKSSGPPLAVPQIFTVSAQSLVFNFSIQDNIRAAHAGLLATQLSLQEARNGLTEEVVNTYIALDNAVRRRAAAQQAETISNRLNEIVQGRFEAGIDMHVEVVRARRTGLMMQRQELSSEDDIDNLSEHLSNLIGVRLTGADVIHESVPTAFPQAPTGPVPDSPSIKAAQANAASRLYTAKAQANYLLRPQLSFGASYSYISTAFTNYDVYYQRFTTAAQDNPNALSMGVQLSVPLMDFMHRARARAAAADATHARYEAEEARNTFREGNGKAVRARRQLSLGAELAKADRDMAQDELDTILIQLQSAAGASGSGAPLSPRDEQNARLQVQERTLDMLNAELQFQQTEISLMRQEGTLADWVKSSLPAASATTPALTGAPLPARP